MWGGGGCRTRPKNPWQAKKKERGNDQVTDIWNESQVGILMATHDYNKIRSEYLMNEFNIYPSYELFYVVDDVAEYRRIDK